jgi:hypothetical protein
VETASTLVNGLNSILLIHQLTGHDLTLTFVESCIEDAYTFIMKGTFKYDSYYFYKVIIDTSALKYLTIGLK